ncbi:MAG: DUF1853 family protein [Paludibacterium sp.]|uniref:DUF1853 family protein n=1 Tax=Paludibacterium sp. TaxID=1917523 RepID=UPI0025EA3321|nr:DUF1853 family protein [Paludibacterium sp.]MBV8046405.1 DUF1853 family protein [Paludibacterium sp.]MBV8649653.1 DUF1853 family protein [Paludibacterium sp.]
MFLPQSPELPWAHPAVRDLASLLTGAAAWRTAHDMPASLLLGRDGLTRLSALDADPSALEAWLARRPVTRLGHYAEQLLAFWFGNAPHIELAAHNVVLRDGSRTLGEFDFLLRIDGEPWHVETCSKFYLQADAGSTEMVGPSLRDALPLKVAKLSRQLALSRHPLAAAALPAGFAGCRAGALVRGCCFYRQPPRMGRDAPWRGWVAPLTAPWPCTDNDSRWLWLPRLRWLSPALAVASQVSDQASLRALLAEAQAPQMVAEMRESGAGWREWRRGFVLPAGWPQAAPLAALRAKMQKGASMDAP